MSFVPSVTCSYKSAVGIYEPIVKFGGAGATVPLTGFGYSLVKGVIKEVSTYGFLGIFTGGIKATATRVGAAIFFSFIAELIFKPKVKN